jgi:hypothetical protein
MSQIEKLKAKFLKATNNFTYTELSKLLSHLGYIESNVGKTSGSRVRFINEKKVVITVHKPHPGDELKAYAVAQIRSTLKEEGDL